MEPVQPLGLFSTPRTLSARLRNPHLRTPLPVCPAHIPVNINSCGSAAKQAAPALPLCSQGLIHGEGLSAHPCDDPLKLLHHLPDHITASRSCLLLSILFSWQLLQCFMQCLTCSSPLGYIPVLSSELRVLHAALLLITISPSVCAHPHLPCARCTFPSHAMSC